MFMESGRHQFLQIYHSRAMTEPVFRDAVVVFVTPLASQWLSLVSMLDISCSVSIDRCTFLGIAISFLLELSVWCSCLWSLICVMRHCMLAHCNAVPFVLSSLFVL